MAGPSSLPSPVTPSKTKRRFSLDQANRSLPLVQRIVRDIVATHQKIIALQARPTGKPAAKAKAAKTDRSADKPTDKELEGTVDRLQAFVEELTSVGVELKDYQTGLVDFVGRHQGRDVYLCWKLGEESITHWHELHAGFAGRQPIASLDEKE